MLNQFLNQLVKIILIDNAQDSVISVLNDALKVSAERKIQYGYFCKYMDEFIDNQNNKEIANQMRTLTDNIKRGVLEEVQELDLNVIEKLEQKLDNKLEVLEIPKESQLPLRDNLIQYIKYYIYKNDKNFYNVLILNDHIRDNKNMIIEIQKWQSEVKEILNVTRKSFPVITGSSHLDIHDCNKIDSRIEDICKIKHRFEMGNNVVFLYGRPGIGKSTLARLYANDYCKEPNHIVYFIKYNESIEKTLSKLSADNKKYKSEDILKYWEMLSPHERTHILLIIDNFNENTLQGGDKKGFESEISSPFFGRLRDLGIRILITTRIKVCDDVYEVLPVKDTIGLFERFFGEKIQKKDRRNIEQIINAVRGNTMLIILFAHLWKRSNEKEKLLDKIINCQIHEETEELERKADAEIEDLTIYGQTMALLDFSGIFKNDMTKKIFVNVSLLPLSGLEKNTFNEFVGCLDGNILESLIRDSWVLEEENKVFLHPIVREIVRKEGFVTYELCKDYCQTIEKVIRQNRKLVDRIKYKESAMEIFKIFSTETDMDIILVELFYWLSDICDEVAERDQSLDIVKIILSHLDVYDNNELKKAERMSGIAYSMNNSYKNMDDLDKAENLLLNAKKVYEKIEVPVNRIQYERVAGKILNNFGSNYIARSQCNTVRKKEFLKSALSWQKRAFDYRQSLEQRYILEADENIINALKSDVATSYTCIATTYYYLGLYKKAIDNHFQAETMRGILEKVKNMNDNQERIIGCVIQMYKEALCLDANYLKRALSYYPKILEDNYKNQANKSLKTNMTNFLLITRIVLYDKRYSELQNELIDKYRSIINWLEEESLIEPPFVASIKEIIDEMVINKID